jgi:hypothetical protein
MVQDQPILAKAYWLSGPDNHHQHPFPNGTKHSGQRSSADRRTGGP